MHSVTRTDFFQCRFCHLSAVRPPISAPARRPQTRPDGDGLAVDLVTGALVG